MTPVQRSDAATQIASIAVMTRAHTGLEASAEQQATAAALLTEWWAAAAAHGVSRADLTVITHRDLAEIALQAVLAADHRTEVAP